MDAGSQLVALGDLHQEGAERPPLLGGEALHHVVLVGGPDLPHCGQHTAARVGEFQLVVAPVPHAALPHDEPLLLQVVEQRDDPARDHAELLGQRLLAQARLDRDQPQDADIPRLQVEVGQPLRKPGRGERTDLGQQEAEPLRRLPSPFTDQATIVGYFRAHPDPVLVMALLQFAASLPLAIYAATISVRLQQLGVRAPGATIGLVGGVLAATSMAFSAMCSWALSRPEVLAQTSSIRLVHDLAFITGGPGFVVPGGLLIAGIAVPGLLARLLPRWLAWAGLVLAALAMIATLVVALPGLTPLLPIVRFPSFAWLIVVAFQLPRRRAAAPGRP
jgi:hypothetical protein